MKFFIRTLLSGLLVAVSGSLTVPAAHAVPEPSPCKCPLPAEWMTPGPPTGDKADFPPPPAGDRGYDVLSYDLDIRLFPETREISGTVAIGLSALAPGLSGVRLDLVDQLTCDGIIFRGQDAVFVHQGDSLVIACDPPLATAAPETLTVSWHGRPPPHGNFLSGLMFRYHDAGTPDDPTDDVPMIANQNQPWSAHSWWPCKDHPADKAQVSLRATVPEPFTLISNGELLGEDAPEPGLRRFAWREAYPIATYLVSVAATDYVSWSEECDPGRGEPVRLDFHVYPHHQSAGEIDLAPTCDMLTLMTDLAGPYPFPGEKYAQSEIKWFGSMEHQTATSMSQIVFTGDRYYELVVIHELAHQWFGDSLTPRVWSDIWLNEGFARYCEALWIENTLGGEDYRDYMRLIGPERHPDLFVNDGILIDPDPILPNAMIYDKGAWVLHMLRMWIGPDAFREFLFAYATDPELVRGTVTLDDMIRHAEAAAGRDLSGFFDPWLTTSAVPVITTESVRRGSAHGDQEITVTFTQLQDPVFSVAVPVTVHGECQELPGMVNLTKASETFTWSLPCRIDSVSVDPEGVVLMRTAPTPPPALQVVGPWPNPVMAPEGEFMLYLMSDMEVTVKWYDARGSLLGDSNLGQLSATGAPGEPDTQPHLWPWPSGRLAAGVYWVEFNAPGARLVRKLTLLR